MEEDPLVQALPPATDYLTYLTLLEYQLTPERLPLLHQLLQDERLTTNIGWDLVNLLLPMLPASTDCLHDVARLGNPREVILRASEALMHLQPDEEEEDEGSDDEEKPLPLHILKFNCLLAMLSVLHSRIKTKSPSRFIATSLQAALEAYTTMPTDETTLALLEFLRDVSPNKRPAPPPRAPSESSVLRVAQASAPDPEAEATSPSPSADNETTLVRKFIQFGLLELLKSYLLSFSSPMDPGLSWTIRMQENLHPALRLPGRSQTDAYAGDKELKERDMIMGKILALSRDVGIDSNDLVSIISQSAENQPPPLDFEEPPATADSIPLERHGSLLLLAARIAGATLFSSGHSTPTLPVFPDLASIFRHFLGDQDNLDEVAFGQPQALLDSLLALTVHAIKNPIPAPSSDAEFKDFLIALTACTARQSHAIIRQIPTTVLHSHPSPVTRFKLIRKVLEDNNLRSVRESAIEWLKEEVLGTSAEISQATIFHDPLYLWTLFPLLFQAAKDAAGSGLVDSWAQLTQTDGSLLHSALNLYYLLLLSPQRDHLQLEKTVLYFRSQVSGPLRELFQTIEADLPVNGGDGAIEATVGEDICQLGVARSVGLIGLTLDQIDEVISDAFDETELGSYSEADDVRVKEIRRETDI
ncbi:hypothetical protein N7512_008799 [Penicillium capsulatum]|nr:hypothetical protein N7512_008799 [Penicillium capsulatum]